MRWRNRKWLCGNWGGLTLEWVPRANFSIPTDAPEMSNSSYSKCKGTSHTNSETWEEQKLLWHWKSVREAERMTLESGEKPEPPFLSAMETDIWQCYICFPVQNEKNEWRPRWATAEIHTRESWTTLPVGYVERSGVWGNDSALQSTERSRRGFKLYS